MGSEWSEARLDEITELIVDCPHSTPRWTDSGVVVLRNQNIRDGCLDLTSPSFTTEEGYQDRIKRAVPSQGDLVLTREAPMGEVCQIPERLTCCLGQRMVLIRANRRIVEPKYLLFALQSPYLKHQIGWNEGTGTTVSNIRIPYLKAFSIPTPSLSEQRAIAHILGTLDDKIELNRRMNETLEAMAQALFRSWFVDFDPVIDKALAAGHPIPEPLQKRAEARKALGDHRKPLPASIAQHFPDRFIFNEQMGWVPEGWEVAQIRERANSIEYGLTTSATDGPAGPRFLRITDIRGGAVDWDTVPHCAASDADLEKYRIKRGDILVARTGASTGENIHIFDPPDSVFASYLVRFAFKDMAIGRVVGMHMRTRAYFSFVEGIIGGSAQPNASAQVLASSHMLFPSGRIADSFYEIVSLYDQKRSEHRRQSAALSRLRDTLLPKLLSGELRSPDAEKQIEKAL